MAGWFSVNAPNTATGTLSGVQQGGMEQFPTVRPAVPGPTGLAPSEPIRVGPSAQPTDPTNPNAQLAGGGGNVDPQAAFQEAVKTLGVSPEQFRSNPEVMNKVTNYLTQKYGGTWTNGGTKAGDWVSYNGQGFDVLPAGDRNWQWLSDPAGSTAGTGGGSLGNFQTGTFTGGGKYPLASVMGTGLAQPWTTPFQAPDPNSVTNDKALQWQMGRGMDAIQRSAASKGTLLTGGLLKSLDTFGQGLASTYYGDVYNRALGEYKMAHDIYGENQSNLYNRLFGVSNMGAQAAGAMGNYGTNYANQATNLQTGMANSQSAGTIGVGNAIGNAVGGVINAAGQLGTGNNTNTSSYNPNATGPTYGDPNYVQGTGAPWNTYQQPYGG